MWIRYRVQRYRRCQTLRKVSLEREREFVQYLYFSKSSAAEVQSHIYVAIDQGYITEEDFRKIYDQAEKVSKLDSAFIKYLDSEIKKTKKPRQ